ncbi:hypothetical protein ACFLXK_01780 [Chloroflexota bacterium]
MNSRKIMRAESDRLTKTGKVISRVTNPCFLSILVLALMAATASMDTNSLIGLIVALFIFLVLLPTVYVFVRTYKNRDLIRLIFNPTVFLKQHPKDVLVVALLFGLSGQISLFFLDAPLILLYTYAALFMGSIVVALFNIFYRVSYHIGAITILAVMVVITWGQNLLPVLFAFPVIGWAKYQIHDHTLIQLISGAAVGIVISSVVLLLYL